jgi:hypothetical protein
MFASVSVWVPFCATDGSSSRRWPASRTARATRGRRPAAHPARRIRIATDEAQEEYRPAPGVLLTWETGLESVYYSHGSSLLTTNHFFSMRHDGEFHFSSCLVLQNLGKSRKRPMAAEPARPWLSGGTIVLTASKCASPTRFRGRGIPSGRVDAHGPYFPIWRFSGHDHDDP